MNIPLRILLVEDAEDDVRLLMRELQRGGYDPTYECVDTAEAMRMALAEKTWDVVIADYTLPRFDGVAALRLLQESGLDLPFIIVSGAIGEETAVAAMRAGAHDYLMKDRLSRLVGAVKRELHEAEVRRTRRQMEGELRQRNADLDTLLHVTSHDLREPLRSVQSFARLVRDRYAACLDDRGKDFLRRIAQAADRLDRLLEDILTLSRAQRLAGPAEEVEAAAIVAEVLDRLAVRVKESKARIQVAADLPRLRVDRTWGTQAVYNLVANALKFTRDGEAPDVEIAGYKGADDTAAQGLVVRDRGFGVAPEHAERIFQLFQRAVGREIEGTGAGLAIVRQIAQRHGGRAWHQPRPGGGAEFIITFRAAARNGGTP